MGQLCLLFNKDFVFLRFDLRFTERPRLPPVSSHGPIDHRLVAREDI